MYLFIFVIGLHLISATLLSIFYFLNKMQLYCNP
nr:MAG TPA: hypothetical protein [Caudoviricetes sp.]